MKQLHSSCFPYGKKIADLLIYTCVCVSSGFLCSPLFNSWPYNRIGTYRHYVHVCTQPIHRVHDWAYRMLYMLSHDVIAINTYKDITVLKPPSTVRFTCVSTVCYFPFFFIPDSWFWTCSRGRSVIHDDTVCSDTVLPCTWGHCRNEVQGEWYVNECTS